MKPHLEGSTYVLIVLVVLSLAIAIGSLVNLQRNQRNEELLINLSGQLSNLQLQLEDNIKTGN